MKFGDEFMIDIEEAFAYFKSKQLKAIAGNEQAVKQIQAVKIETWVATMLRKPVYDLLGEKRTLPEQED